MSWPCRGLLSWQLDDFGSQDVLSVVTAVPKSTLRAEWESHVVAVTWHEKSARVLGMPLNGGRSDTVEDAQPLGPTDGLGVMGMATPLGRGGVSAEFTSCTSVQVNVHA